MSTDNFKSRLMRCMLYPDNPDHLLALEAIRAEIQYVAILHDKDVRLSSDVPDPDDLEDQCDSEFSVSVGELKKPHFHLIFKFPSARYRSAVASSLGIEQRFIRKCSNFEGAARYLVHDNAPDKYQYDLDCLEGPLAPAVAKILAQNDENVRVLELLGYIDSMGFITYSSLISLACEKGLYSDLRRMGYLVSRVVDEHNANWSSTYES